MYELLAIMAGLVVVGLFLKGGTKLASIEPEEKTSKPATLDDQIRAAGEKNGVPFEILKAVVKKESNFNPKAWNDERKKGDDSDDAIGLMQIRQGALTDYNRAHGTTWMIAALYDPEINLEVGSWYLGSLIKKHGINPGIEMYNVGETGYLRKGVRNTAYLAFVVKHSENYSA